MPAEEVVTTALPTVEPPPPPVKTAGTLTVGTSYPYYQPFKAGPKDNRVVERRPDILVYSGEELAEDLEAIGPVTATIRVRTSGEHFDVHVRLCDVHPDGRSVNLTDGIRRVCPGEAPPDSDGVRAVEIELWPIGHVFKRGHRLRVHMAGGAHPRSARNPGTGEPLGSAMTMRVAQQSIHHDPRHPSAIVLPVRP